MAETKIIKAENQYTYALCAALRYECFIIEQNCPVNEEITPTEDDCHHYLAFEGEVSDLEYVPMGTARWREYKQGVAKIERVATKGEYRGKGVASKLLQQIIADIKEYGGYQKIVLGAQDTAMPLYEKHGFKVYGEGFVEAGIDHHMMERDI